MSDEMEAQLIDVAAACAVFSNRFADELVQSDVEQFARYAVKLKQVIDGIKQLTRERDRLKQLADYLDDPQVLLQIPQPHRLRISELLHGKVKQDG